MDCMGYKSFFLDFDQEKFRCKLHFTLAGYMWSTTIKCSRQWMISPRLEPGYISLLYYQVHACLSYLLHEDNLGQRISIISETWKKRVVNIMNSWRRSSFSKISWITKKYIGTNTNQYKEHLTQYLKHGYAFSSVIVERYCLLEVSSSKWDNLIRRGRQDK